MSEDEKRPLLSLERILTLHRRVPWGDPSLGYATCSECHGQWPCITVYYYELAETKKQVKDLRLLAELLVAAMEEADRLPDRRRVERCLFCHGIVHSEDCALLVARKALAKEGAAI